MAQKSQTYQTHITHTYIHITQQVISLIKSVQTTSALCVYPHCPIDILQCIAKCRLHNIPKCVPRPSFPSDDKYLITFTFSVHLVPNDSTEVDHKDSKVRFGDELNVESNS